MRAFRAVIPLFITIIVVFLLNRPLGKLPALGKLLDPVSGCWASAEAIDKDFSADLRLPGLKDLATVWFDESLKAHIRAKNDHDILFTGICSCLFQTVADGPADESCGRTSKRNTR